MGEIIVSAVVTLLVEKLFSDDLMNLARSEGIDSRLNKWNDNLSLIQAVLADAGEKQKISNTAVGLWLHNLHDLAYDIDDVLDDLATEAIRCKLNQEYRASTNTGKVMIKMIPTCCTNFTPRNIKYGRNISSKLEEITAKLQHLVNQRKDLGLDVINVVRPNEANKSLEQTSGVDESKIIGREGDKEALIGKLLGNEACNENVSIVSIVGIGGIGKTTLARVLYNDDRVKHHFERRAWVCVAEEFNVLNISKAIFEAVTGEDKNFSNLEPLQGALREELSKKKFLLVLDDVWNEDFQKWELLQSPFVVAAAGSKVIVTTRKRTVTSMMDSFEDYNLDVLSHEKALSLFAQYAIGKQDFEQHPTLKSNAEGIVKKCGRLPLALITLGRVLKRKTSEDEWEELLNSKIWELPDANGILAALRLSYYDLPSHLKQLFAYCSLIPKDYEFDKNELVLLWMAEGFLSKSNRLTSMERLGREYFEELQSRSFFQHSTHEESRYTMHDLINDLAKSVAGKFFFMLDEKMDADYGNQSFEKLRHFSFIGRRHGDGVYRKFKELQRARRMRTFLSMQVGNWGNISLSNADLDELLPRLQFLRVLSLARCSITKIPQSIGNLKHMRCLNFSHTAITCLPEKVNDLYNLQSLLLSRCLNLCSLPAGLAKLKNLRHLDISYTPDLKKMPLGIGRLSCLQTLSKVIIEGPNDGFKICELKDLSDVQGRLSIEGLHNVTNAGQAKDANLQKKKGLDELMLQWSEVFDFSRNETAEYEVLKELRPHHMLKKLEIRFYGGMEFPSWFMSPSFDQLTELKLRGCKSCTHVSTLGHLRSLEVLGFYDLKCWEKWSTSGGDKNGTATSFPCLRRISIERCPKLAEVSIASPSLEELEFFDMEGLEIWSTSGGDKDGTAKSFPCLREISIKRCLKLAEVSVGSMPLLRVLKIDGCFEAVISSLISMSWSILTLDVRNIKGLIQLHGEYLKHLAAVEYVRIEDCDELRYLWESESEACKFLVSLRRLEVWKCRNLVSLGEKKEVVFGVGNTMESIKQVCLYGCGKLESYNCPNSVELLKIFHCSSMTSLTFLSPVPSSLKILIINRCKNLKSFPHQHLQLLTSLEELWIVDCPSMDYSFPCGLWPPNLKELVIGGLKKPMVEWGPQNYPTSLVHLTLLYGENSGVVSFGVERSANINTISSSFLLPLSLKSLEIWDFKDVGSLAEVLQHLTCLEDLRIWRCPKLKDLPETTSSLRIQKY